MKKICTFFKKVQIRYKFLNSGNPHGAYILYYYLYLCTICTYIYKYKKSI